MHLEKLAKESAIALFNKTTEKAAKESDYIIDNLYRKIIPITVANLQPKGEE